MSPRQRKRKREKWCRKRGYITLEEQYVWKLGQRMHSPSRFVLSNCWKPVKNAPIWVCDPPAWPQADIEVTSGVWAPGENIAIVTSDGKLLWKKD